MTKPVALALGLEAVILAALVTVVLDQYAHKRVDHLGGVNIWGYRGAVMSEQQPNEIRLAIVGGDYAFGWGVAAGETVAPNVRRLVSMAVDRPGQDLRPVTAVNLGAQTLPLDDYADRINHYGYLAPDVICLYVDLARGNGGATLPAHDSLVTALTGYVPMLPLVLEEKGRVLAERAAGVRGAVLAGAGRALRSADRTLYRLVADDSEARPDRRVALDRAIDEALDAAAGVVVVLPAPVTSVDRVEHAWMLEVAEARAAAETRLRVVDLARHRRLYDADVRLDGVNFGAGGHALVAEEIAPAVIALVAGLEAS